MILASVVAFGVFKMPYIQLKGYYKQHLHEIDVMLPYYLKSLEILIQHYTVPVAIGKSIAINNSESITFTVGKVVSIFRK